MELKQTLTKAKALIEKGWCQKAYAENAKGQAVRSGNPSACRWCLRGALQAVCEDEETWMEDYRNASNALIDVLGGEGLVAFNDSSITTQQMVLDVFDRAIESRG